MYIIVCVHACVLSVLGCCRVVYHWTLDCAGHSSAWDIRAFQTAVYSRVAPVECQPSVAQHCYRSAHMTSDGWLCRSDSWCLWTVKFFCCGAVDSYWCLTTSDALTIFRHLPFWLKWFWRAKIIDGKSDF